jgi:hypothetical protein
MSYKCHQKRKIVHSQRKSFTHKETLDSINQSDVGLPHQIEKTKNKKQQYEKLQIHNRTKWL